MLKLSKFEKGILIHCIIPPKLSLKNHFYFKTILLRLKNVVFYKVGQTKKKVQKYAEDAYKLSVPGCFSFLSLEISKKGKVKTKTKPLNDGSVIVLLLFSPC